MMKPVIIGVTGFIGAGKDTFANYLVKKKGFVHYSLSDILREEAKKKSIKITRENLQRFANELRARFGNDILARKAVEKIMKEKQKRNYVITSIRNKAEIETLRMLENFFLVFIEAPLKLRFERIKARDGKPKKIEEFKKQEEKELKGKENEQQLILCKSLADLRIKNDSTLSVFYSRIEKLLKRLEKEMKKT